MHHIQTIISNNYTIKRCQHEGQEHIVAPVVLLTEGVHSGSGGPLYYPADELAKMPAIWNGIPLPVQHPENNGTPVAANSPEILDNWSVGRLFNVHWAPPKLRGEIWVNINKARRIAPEVLLMLETTQALEVSTGLFTEDEMIAGAWNGETYDAIARNFRPDHLALLPGARGACNYEDGCGVRLNEGEDDMPKNQTPVKNNMGLIEKIKRVLTNEMSFGEISSSIQQQVDSLDTPTVWNFLEEVYDGFIIYRTAPGPQANETQFEPQLFKRSFSESDEAGVTLGEEVEEVRKETNYVAKTNQQDDEENVTITDNQEDEEDNMEESRKVMLATLTANKRISVTDEEQTALIALETCEEFAVQVNALLETGVEVEDDQTTNEADDSSDEELTTEQYIANAPEGIREALTGAVKTHDSKRTDMIAGIIANKTNTLTEDQLKSFSMEQLEGIAILAKVNNFAGRAHGASIENDGDSTVEPMDLPTLNEQSE